MGTDPTRLRAIYLDDHLALLVAGEALVRRMLGAAKDAEIRAFLAQLQPELANDRHAVEELLAEAGASPSPAKRSAARLAVWAGRFKLNGSATGYSPLSRAVELAGIRFVLEGDRGFWRTIERLGEGGDASQRARRLDERMARAEELRLDATEVALTGGDRRL